MEACGWFASANSNFSKHAISNVSIARPDQRGQVSAHAKSFASFTDLVTVGDNGLHSGETNVDFTVSLHVSGILRRKGDVFSFAGASVSAQVWLFAFERFVPLTSFVSGRNAQYFESFSAHSANLNGQSTILGSFTDLSPGSKYWVHAESTVEAAAHWENGFTRDLSASASGDYGSTLNVFIDPSPDNPNATYSTASGVSLLSPAPVPLPAALWLIAPALGELGLVCRRQAS